MESNECPRCGWPLAELPGSTANSQRVSQGRLEYVRCLCGSWLARVDGVVVGATKSQLGQAQC
ncbi:hypothetical protein [Amycolatopsis regifaucium]|uniref:Uncharacterized protein n=1 Tax=Amycolatopsis regifaucium TaxID=546365 RepID=A0A154MRX5_9PSEU|nr:hypothetical protein [Amycolatopsis regifaucium]KZB86527.1 hypothetical protein AVL48_26145 [Amycolatopsis regifaucium]OKA03472.1 hypothetical protein ATP06_0235790 [Amycolatopsis regifaucium]